MNTIRPWTRALSTILLALACSAAAAAHAHHLLDWTLVDLGALFPRGSSNAVAVTNRGAVTGFFTAPSGAAHGFLWKDGTFLDLGAPPGSTESFMNDINIDERIVGSAGGQAVAWQDGAWIPLGFAGEARAIARNGDIAGNIVVNNVERGVLLRNGVLTDIGSLTGIAARITAMNDADHIVGRASLADGNTAHAFLWADGSMRDLGALGRRNSVATGINNHNMVVGFASDGNEPPIGFLWYGRMFRLLPALTGVFPAAINDRGDIVGDLSTVRGAFLIADGEFLRVDQLPAVRASGLTDILLRGISERRWIVGEGVGAGGHAHAFVLMPGITSGF